MNEEISASILFPIEVDEYADAYYELDEVYPPETREQVFAAVSEIIEVNDMHPDQIIVAGYALEGDTNDYKLQAEYEGGVSEYNQLAGNDSDLHSFIIQEIESIRLGRLSQLAELTASDEWLETPPKRRQVIKNEIDNLRSEIEKLKTTLQKTPNVPSFYFTGVEGLLSEDSENNPLAYAGSHMGKSVISLYDRSSMEEAGLEVNEYDRGKGQIQCFATHEQLKEYVVASLFLNIRNA